MREFTLEDGFTLSEILDKTGIQLDLNAFADAAKDKDKQAYVGGQLVLAIIKKVYLARNEIVKLMANMTGEDEKEVRKWNIPKMKKFFNELLEMDGLKDFFN